MRVRTSSPTISALIQQAAARSTMFHGVIAEIGNTDGIVYVEPGKCPHGVRACLLMEMAISGSNRLLYVLVDTKRADTELMAAIAHELRHAVEVLSNRSLKTGTAMYFFYRLTGTSLGRGAFETTAAVETGQAVRKQLRSSPSR